MFVKVGWGERVLPLFCLFVVVIVCLSCLFVFLVYFCFLFYFSEISWGYVVTFILWVLYLYYFAVFEFNVIKNCVFILETKLKKIKKTFPFIFPQRSTFFTLCSFLIFCINVSIHVLIVIMFSTVTCLVECLKILFDSGLFQGMLYTSSNSEYKSKFTFSKHYSFLLW